MVLKLESTVKLPGGPNNHNWVGDSRFTVWQGSRWCWSCPWLLSELTFPGKVGHMVRECPASLFQHQHAFCTKWAHPLLSLHEHDDCANLVFSMCSSHAFTLWQSSLSTHKIHRVTQGNNGKLYNSNHISFDYESFIVLTDYDKWSSKALPSHYVLCPGPNLIFLLTSTSIQ